MTDLNKAYMGGLCRGGIPCQLNRPGHTSCQGLGRRIAEGRHFGEIVEDLWRQMDETAYLWRVASQDVEGVDEGRRGFWFGGFGLVKCRSAGVCS